MFKVLPCVAVLLLAVACTRQSANAPAPEEPLASTIRELGFQCEGITGLQEAGEGAWRVTCSGAETYTAFATAAGEVCVEPVFVGDGPGPGVAALVLPAERCTPSPAP